MKDITTKRISALLFAVDNIRRQAEETRHVAATADLLIKQRARINAAANQADEIATVLQGMADELTAKEEAILSEVARKEAGDAE